MSDHYQDGGDDRDGPRAMRAVVAAMVLCAIFWVALWMAAQ